MIISAGSLREKTQFFSLPKVLPPENMDEIFGIFADVLSDSEAVEIVQSSLHQFFLSKKFDVKIIKEYYFTFWRWYVELSFFRLSALSSDDVLIVFSTQLSSAFQLNLDVENNLFYYLFRHFSDEKPLELFFYKLSRSIADSKILLHPCVENSPIISDVINQYTKLKLKNEDTLALADYLSSIQRTLFPNGQVYEIFEDSKKTEITKSFLELLYFFAQEKNIGDAVARYIENIVPDRKQVDISSATISDVPAEENKLEIFQNTDIDEVNQDKQEIEKSPNIPSLVDAKFEKDETGQYQDIEGVFAYLDELATERGDDSIREMLYFDETSGGFVWKRE